MISGMHKSDFHIAYFGYEISMKLFLIQYVSQNPGLLLQGKLIEIHFSVTGKISGASIQTCKCSGLL